MYNRRNKHWKTGNEGFTLAEVMIAVAVLLVIFSIAFLVYTGLVDRARAEACQTNLKVLNVAVELYNQEYGAVPAVLGDLRPEHLKKAYAQVMEQSDWHTRFALAFLKMSLSKEAYAQFLTYENLNRFGAAKDTFRCPEDENGGVSYGINSNIAGKKWFNIGANVVIVGDCDSHVFSDAAQLTKRHSSGKVAIALTKGGAVTKIGDESDDTSDTGGGDATFDVDGDGDGDAGDSLAGIYDELQNIFANSQGTPLGDKMEDVVNKLSQVSTYLEAGDNSAAAGAIEGAIGHLQAAVNDGLLDSAQGQGFIDDLTAKMNEINPTI